MKNETTRTKTLSGFSSRAIAMVLCFVMLLTAIGSGSVLSAIAADFEGNGAAVLVDAAKAGADVDAPAPGEAAAEDKTSDEPFVDDIEDSYKLTKKSSDVDLAMTGYGINTAKGVQIQVKDSGSSDTVNGVSVTSANPYYINCTHDTNNNEHWYGDAYFGANTSGGVYGYNVRYHVYGDNGWDDYIALGGYYLESGTTYNNTFTTGASDDNLRVQESSTGYTHVYFDLWNDKVKVQMYTVNALTYSTLSSSAGSSLTSGDTTNLSSTGSNGSGDYTYTYKVTKDTSTGTDVTSSTLSGTTFTAPAVTSSTTYVVTGTMKDNKCPNLTKKTKTYTITVSPKQYYYLWGGKETHLHQTNYLTDLKYNSATGKYVGTYKFDSATWYSMMPSSANNSSTFTRVWNSYPEVAWSLDTYNNGTVYTNQSSHKDYYPTGAFSKVEITNYINNGADSWGLHITPVTPNTTVTITFDPSTEVLAFSDAEVTSATIYAKDGTINDSSTSKTYASIANTRIYKEDGSTTAGTNTTVTGEQSYETYTAKKGETVVIKTTIGHNAAGSDLSNATELRSKYYVRGFCINGEVPELLTHDSNGVYTLTYTVPEDYEGGAIEITPIYYLASTTNPKVVTFRINGFTDNLKEVGAGKPNWGNTLYAYPFYGNLGGYNNAFGSYPGQPLVYNKGQYQIQIPTKSTAWERDTNTGSDGKANNKDKTLAQIQATNVSGITMSNGYYDTIHKSVMGYGDNSASADHVQTYDYGDFYKIFNEKDPDNIVFEFKYKTKKHNLEKDTTGTAIAASTLTSAYGSTNGNGFEPLKNYHGKNVDLFGTPLSGDAADTTKTPPVYVVSIGGVNGSSGVENVAGYYASAWRVYVPNDKTSTSTNYRKITSSTTKLKNSIPPEVLILNDSSKFDNTTYPSADSSFSITDWKSMYQELEAYRGLPVYISYEAADAQVGAGNYATSGSGGATRNDGRWLYSSKGENISSNIRIDVSDDNGVTYKDNSTLAPPVTGLSAYFTNTEAYGEQTYATTIDADKTFDFEASTTNASYMFVGWYLDNGIKITTDNVGHTERSGSYTLVARFMKVTAGQLIMQHSTNTDNTYKGAGTSKIAVQVTDSEDKVLATYPSADTITIPKKYITNTHLDYKIKVTLTSTPSGYDTYGTTSLDTTDDNVTTAKFFNNVQTSTSSGVTTKTFNFTVGALFSGSTQQVSSLLYNSYYGKTTFNYDITFNYTGRKIGTETADRSYKRSGTLTPAQVTSYLTKSGSTYTLSQDFITTLAPHESNFNETLVWTLGDVTSTSTTFTECYTASVPTTGTNIRSAARTATFDMGKGDATVNYNVTFGQLIKNGDNYITADPMYNGQYFQYWLIQTDNADASKRVEVAKCYSNKFNYLAYDNYYITAVYASSPFSYGSDGASATISYLDTTRNQWNNSGNGGYTTSVVARDKASDLLFNDFALSYGYNGQRLYENNNAVSGKDVEVGFIVERVRTMDIKQDGSYDTDVSKYTASGSDATTAKTNATAAINNISVSGFGAAKGTDSYNTYTKYKLDRTKLDNKNRIEFFYALYNAYGGSDSSGNGTDGNYLKNFTYKNYVYRAYSYIKVGDTLTVTDDPAYFIMYDEATK